MNLIELAHLDGIKAYEDRRFSDAVRALTPSAEAGNADAQYMLGDIYMLGGKDVFEDEELAWRFYLKAADQGHIKAMASLLAEDISARKSNHTHIPLLDESDLRKTVPEIRAALEVEAEQNCAAALQLLGMFELEGVGVEADTEKAVAYFKKAMDLGDLPSKMLYALFSETLTEDEPDFSRAVRSLEEAFETGKCPHAGLMLGRFHIEGTGHCGDRRRGYSHLVAAAENGVNDAAYLAGNCKANGIGTTQNEQEAYEWYRMAARGGCRDAF
jgi:uncharacterized protein